MPAFPFSYKCRINVQYVSDELINKLIKLNFIEVGIVISADKYLSADINWIDTLRKYSEGAIKYPIFLDFTGGVSSPKIYPKRNIITSDSQFLPNADKYKCPPALVGGFISFATGLYPQTALNNSVKHVKISKSNLGPEDMEALKSMLSINSAVIASMPAGAGNNSSVFYIEDNKTIRSLNEVFDENIDDAYNNNFYLPHLFLVKEKSNRYPELIIDDFNTHSPLQLSYTSYADVDTVDSKELNFLSIETSEDLDRFLQDVGYFISNAGFRHEYEITHYIKDECRWLPSPCCSVCKLPRLRFKDSLIFTCGGCNKSIGSIRDSYFKVYQQSYIISEEAQVERNCAECPVKNECSKCCFLPEFLQGSRFCDVMRKHPYISLYIATRSALKMLFESPVLQSIKLSDIRTSNRFTSQLIPDQIAETGSMYLYPYIYLFHANSQHYIFNAVTRKLFGISEAMAVVAEFLQKGTDAGTIKSFLSEKYCLVEDNAGKTFTKAIDMFAESGCLQKRVV